MNRAHGVGFVVLSMIAAQGCDGSETADAGIDAGATVGAFARFAPDSSGPVTFLAVPFPGDLYLDEDGHVSIGHMGRYPAMLQNLRIELSRRTAFCRICAVTFGIEGALDPSSVPSDAGPEDTASVDDPLILMRADGEGGPLSLQVDYHDAEGQLIIRPRYGTVLEPGARYVAAVTDAIRCTDDAPLAPSPVFAALRDGGETDAAGERARPMVEEALSALEAAGVTRGRVVSATVFTVEDDARLVREVADVARAAPVPALTVDRTWSGSELDELMGVPTEDRPGIDIPPADGIGERSVVHDAIGMVITGTFSSPRVVEGSGSDIGLLRRDAEGVLTAGPDPEAIPWTLVVPAGVPLGEVPVVLVHHGFPGSMQYALNLGNTFAREGMATFSYNAFQLGGRSPDPEDSRNELLDRDGADGFVDKPDGDTLNARVRGWAGAAPGQVDRLDHWLAFEAQVELDVAMALRLLAESDLAPVVAADASLTMLSFDAGQIYFLGQSFGGRTGMAALPLFAGRVQAAVLSVGPPGALEHACSGPKNRAGENIPATIYGVDGPTAADMAFRLCMTPQYDLVRWLMQPFAPAHTLHFALEAPIETGEVPDVLFYYADNDVLLGSPSGEQILGEAGVPVHGNTYHYVPPPFVGPLSANFDTPAGTITAGGIVWDACHGLLSFASEEIGYEHPFHPPFAPLDTDVRIDNPITQAHEHLSHFFRTRRSAGRGEILDPSTL